MSENAENKSGGFGQRDNSAVAAAQSPSAGQGSPIVPKSAIEVLRPEPGVPRPKKRSKAARSQVIVFMNFMMSLAMFLTLAAGLAFYIGKHRFDATGPTTEAKAFMVPKGAGIDEISQSLARNGLITDPRIFNLATRAFRADKSLKAGEYEIKAGASMRDILATLRSGKSVLYSLTIPEGLTVEQILSRIRTSDVLIGDLPPEIPAEGTLLADTQRFSRGTTRAEILAKLASDQKKLVDEIWARRAENLPVKDINEFVTLASIVEKETGRSDERSRVAGVFINRLNQGMRLQSDPTIIYGIYGGKGKPADVPIRRSDIDKLTAYNTYQIDGLPPTPIANPGRAALEAVANPSTTEELFFVADGTGGHVFAKTLDEHNENVARWREIEKKAAEEAEKAKATGATPEAPADPAAPAQ
ncbi:MAG: endolytic transglycosylase MltG [Rhizobiaceae bacterium]